MPSIDQNPLLLPSPQIASSSKKRTPRTVLGLGNILLQRPDNSQVRSRPSLPKPPVSFRKSLSPRRRRKPRAEIQNINTLSFFEPDSTVHVEDTTPSPSSPVMTATQERQPRPARRQVLRVDAQDGPWTVSVAENHHPSSYTLYVKSECPFTKDLSEILFHFSVCRSFTFPFHFTLWARTPSGSLVTPIWFGRSFTSTCPTRILMANCADFRVFVSFPSPYAQPDAQSHRT